MFGFHGDVQLICCCGEYAIRGRGRECILTFISTFHAMWVQGKCPFSCKDSFLTLLKCRFMLTSVFSSTLESVPCQAITCDRPGSAEAQITIRQKVLGLVYAELRQSAFSSVATIRNLTDQAIKELIPQSDCDAHSVEDEDISAQNDSNTGNTTETNITQWTDNTNC